MFSKLKFLVASLLIGTIANAAYFPTVSVNNFDALGVYNLTPPTLTNGQTSNLQLDVNGNLNTYSAAEITQLSAVNGYLFNINAKTPSLGQSNMVGSSPVTIASDQSAVPVSVSSVPLATGAATSALQTTGNTSLGTIATNTTAISGQLPATLGTKTTANSLAVNIASDQTVPTTTVNVSPATQTITIQDTGSTTNTYFNGQIWVSGTPTANSFASFSAANFDTGMIQISGTWTGSLVCEISVDGGTTWISHGLHQIGSAFFGSTFTNNFTGSLSLSSKTNVRIRATAAITGTATIRIIEGKDPSNIYVANAIKLSDSISNSIATVKAASTAPTTSDTAIVVATSPNSPAPKASVNFTGSGSTAGATVSTVTTLTSPSNTVGFILMNLDTSTTNMRWAVGRTASTTLGQQLQPGRDSGFVPIGANVSIIAESGTCNYDIQWISQ